MSSYTVSFPILKYQGVDLLYYTTSNSSTAGLIFDVASAGTIHSLFIASTNISIPYASGIKFVNGSNFNSYIRLSADLSGNRLKIYNGSTTKYLSTAVPSYVTQPFSTFINNHPNAYIISIHYYEYGEDDSADTLYPVIYRMDYDGSYDYTLYYFTGSSWKYIGNSNSFRITYMENS